MISGSSRSRNDFTTISSALLAGLLLAACSSLKPLPVDPAEAQKMVFQAFVSSKPPQVAASYTILGSQAGFNGQVVAFWMCQPATFNSPAVVISGYGVVRKYFMSQGVQNFMEGTSPLRPCQFLKSPNNFSRRVC